MAEMVEDESFQGLDWYDERLENRAYLRCHFVRADLTEVTILASTFQDCTFDHVDFNAASLRSSALINCRFIDCNFFNASFIGCKLVGSSFVNCALKPVHVSEGDWSFVRLARANLGGARFENVRMRECVLDEADLSGARLTGCDLYGASADQTKFLRADLRGSALPNLTVDAAYLLDAMITVQQAFFVAALVGLDVRDESVG
ncbi:MAG: pentapeptide repeat-containing protein [Antricoccus sp.]